MDFTLRTAFEALAREDEENDADGNEVVAPLQQLTPNIKKGKKLSQKQSNLKKKGPPPLTKKQIAAIADEINKGELGIPELDLRHDSD